MKKTAFAAIIGAAGLLWMMSSSGSAYAQLLLRNPNVMIDYVEPEDPAHLNIDVNDPTLDAQSKTTLQKTIDDYTKMKGARDRLMKSQLLERYSQFLAALRLPTTLRLRTKKCGEVNAFFDSTDSSVNLCYEYVLALEGKAPKTTTSDGFTPEGTLTGMIVSTMLHETGHALFSIYTVPILGKEEDAADEIAGFMMMQFGQDVALTTIKGAAWKWAADDWTNPVYYDVHSSSQARFYNFLCMAYGGNPTAFKPYADRYLPAARAPNCAYEYQLAKIAFDKTILPHIDPELMKKVESLKWLTAAEMDPKQAPSVPSPTVKREQ